MVGEALLSLIDSFSMDIDKIRILSVYVQVFLSICILMFFAFLIHSMGTNLPRSPEKINRTVWEEGIEVGIFPYTKAEAEVFCIKETARTGSFHDWHFVGGWTRVLRMP